MPTLKATTLWLLYSLGVTTLAHPDSNDTGLKRLTQSNNEGSKILNRQASDQCTGDCATCFGAGFQLCPSSSSVCYLPGDAAYGEESCSASSGSGTSTSPSSTDYSSPTTDTCANGGLSCDYCFGGGYIQCPQSAQYCYDPNNSTTSCPGDAGTGIGTDSMATDSASSSAGTGFANDSGSTFTSSPTTDIGTSTASASEASSTDGVLGGSSGDTPSSATSTRSSSSSSATGGGNSNGNQGTSGSNGNNNQGSSTTNDSNGHPIQKSSGHSVAREGLFSGLVAGSVAYVAAWHLLI